MMRTYRGPGWIPAMFMVAVMVSICGSPFVSADGGMIPVVKMKVYEPGQKAVIAWNGVTERMYLSVDIYGEGETQGFHVVPFPSEPRITLGDHRVLTNFTRLFRSPEYYYDGASINTLDKGPNGSGRSVEIVFEEMIGVHDVTVIHILDPEQFRGELMEIVRAKGLDIEAWPPELNDIISSYTTRGFEYFSIDRFPISKKIGSIEPLVYEFETARLVFPLEISSMLEGETLVVLGLMTPECLPVDLSVFSSVDVGLVREKWINSTQVLSVDPGLEGFFESGVHAIYIDFKVDLKTVRDDIFVPELERASWMRTVVTTTFDQGLYQTYDVPGTDRSLLVWDPRWAGSWSENPMRCFDRSSGGFVWEIEPERFDRSLYSSTPFFLDLVGSDDPEIVLVDQYENDLMNIQCIDIGTGSALWTTPCQTGLIGSSSVLCDAVKDREGKTHLAVFAKGRQFMDLMGSNGEFLTSGVLPFSSSVLYQVRETHVIDCPHGGQMLVYISNRGTGAWSPSFHTEGGKVVRTTVPNASTDHLWMSTGIVEDVFEYDGTSYGIVAGSDSIERIDLSNGLTVRSVTTHEMLRSTYPDQRTIRVEESGPKLYFQYDIGYQQGGDRQPGHSVYTVKTDIFTGRTDWGVRTDAGDMMNMFLLELGEDTAVITLRTYDHVNGQYVPYRSEVVDVESGVVVHSVEGSAFDIGSGRIVTLDMNGHLRQIDLGAGAEMDIFTAPGKGYRREIDAVSDLDGDGSPEVVFTESNRSYSFDVMVYETGSKECYRIANFFGSRVKCVLEEGSDRMTVYSTSRLYGVPLDKASLMEYKGIPYEEERLDMTDPDARTDVPGIVFSVSVIGLSLVFLAVPFVLEKVRNRKR